MTKLQFIDLLGRLAASVGFDSEIWEIQKKNLYLPQLVAWIIEELWLVNLENEDVETLRKYYKELHSTGQFNEETK